MAAREKSRTPADKQPRQAKSRGEENGGRASKAREESAPDEMEDEHVAKKRLEYTPPPPESKIQSGVPDDTQHLDKKARGVQFQSNSASEEEETKPFTAASSRSPSEATDTTQIALATRRMATPIRSDGTKTPLKKPEKERNPVDEPKDEHQRQHAPHAVVRATLCSICICEHSALELAPTNQTA